MKNIFLATVLLFLCSAPSTTGPRFFSPASSAPSQQIPKKPANGPDWRVAALENFFRKYNSPLVSYAPIFVKQADKYNVDWRLLPAISGVESSFGKRLIPGSYNAYGWGRGHVRFADWENGIETVNRSLRQNYIDKGADSINRIGPIYAEARNWSTRVSYFLEEINEEYIKTFSS